MAATDADDQDEVFSQSPGPSDQPSPISKTANGNLLSPDYGTPRKSPQRSSLVKDGTRRHGVAKKTVSFSSMHTEKKVSNVADCLAYMQQGCELVKVRSNARRYRRIFSLDTDCSHVRWSPTNKKPHKAKIPVEIIREIRVGKQCDVLRSSSDTCAVDSDFPDECAFSVVYGDACETLDLIANSADEANIWVTGLMALASGGGPNALNGADQAHTSRDQWLTEMFEQADADRHGFLTEMEAIRLARALNERVHIGKMKQRIRELDCSKTDETQRGRVTCAEFADLFKDVTTRPEIYFLMVRHSNKDYLTLEDFQQFLENEQGMFGTTRDECEELLRQFEPSAVGRERGHMSIDGFSAYLVSAQCDIFDPAHHAVCHDMSQPLNHYFISSSHNTYLMQDQLKGSSSVDGYVRALREGCRYVEHVWDGDTGEPVVYHGHTLTSQVLASKVLRVIREYAFESSEYPLLVHLENHLCIEQQRVLASAIKDSIGDVLYVGSLNLNEDSLLPSPDDLRRKILIRGKKLPFDAHKSDGEVTEEDESAETNRSIKTRRASQTKRYHPLCRELSDLVCTFLCAKTFVDFPRAVESQQFWQTCSMNEAAASRLANTCAEEFVAYTRRFLTRVYPSGVRVDSSNFNPQEFWNCGCQIAAMNFQTRGLMIDLNAGKFLANGSCGYVLKPASMREDQVCFSVREGGSFPQVLHMKIISAQNLPRPKGSTAKGDSCDPYVVVEVFGTSGDCAEERTRTIHNDSYNPMFDESFEFHVGVPELALLRFLMLDDEAIGDDFIGQFTIPFECLQTGYRHINLRSADGEPLENTTLFVHLAITNKRGGGKPHKRGRSVMKKRHKVQTGIKQLGIKQIDDTFKEASPHLIEAVLFRNSVDQSLMNLQEATGLGPNGALKQAIKTLVSRMQSSGSSTNDQVPAMQFTVLVHDDNMQLETEGTVPEGAKKAYAAAERLISHDLAVTRKADQVLSKLNDITRKAVESYGDLSQLCNESGLKEQKAVRASENFAWNVRILKGQAEALTKLHKEVKDQLAQIRDAAAQAGVLKVCGGDKCTHMTTML